MVPLSELRRLADHGGRPARIAVQTGGAPVLETAGYDWNSVNWHERRKADWDILRGAFARAAAAGPVS